MYSNSLQSHESLDEGAGTQRRGPEHSMCEVEAIVNGRPTLNFQTIHVIWSPRYLTTCCCYVRVPESHLELSPSKTTTADGGGGHLPSLQERQKWHKKQRNFAKDDVVLVLDDNKPCSSWPLGRIMEVYTNRNDALVCSVKLRTSAPELVRPVHKIVLLEASVVSSNDI